MSLLNSGFEGSEDLGFSENVLIFYGRIHSQLEHLTADLLRLQDKFESLSECAAKLRDIDDLYDQIESLRHSIDDMKAEMAKVKTSMAVVSAKSGMIISAVVVILLELVKHFILGM